MLGTELAKKMAARLPASPSGVNKDGGGKLIMKVVTRILTVMLMVAILCIVAPAQMAFGQRGNDNRPPKEQPKIKEKDKPPPSNSNSGGGNSNRKKP